MLPPGSAQIKLLPWRPAVAAVAGYVLGPMAAALVCFANLKRLGATPKGRKIVIATAIACVGLIVLVREVPDGPVLYLAAHVVIPLLFPLLQKREFDAWKAAHLEEPASGWHATGWAIAGLALLFAVAGISLLLFPERVEDIEVQISVPRSVQVGQPFELKIDVKNSSASAQTLRSVVVPWELVARFDGLRSDPRPAKDAPAATGGRYIYRLPLAANSTMQLRFIGTAKHAGAVNADLKICVRTDSNCIARRIETRALAPGSGG